MGSVADDEEAGVDEGPRREVAVPAFAIGRYEVTRAEYAAFVEATGHAGGASGCAWRSPGFEQAADHPVTCVSWEDAQAYVGWLSETTGLPYRLPSESEWEYAARAGTTTRRYWGDAASGQCRYANGADRAAAERFADWTVAACADGSVFTAPVGTFAPNGFGLFDVLGNANEWTADCWNPGYGGAPVDGGARSTGECGLRVVRGGGWSDTPGALRAANRSAGPADLRVGYSGIRVARTIESGGTIASDAGDAVPVTARSGCSEGLGRIGSVGVSREGAWDGSCRSVHYGDGEYARYYSFVLTESGQVVIDLTSPTVDTWLALRYGTGTGFGLLAEDDDGGDGVDARITRRLEAGEYTIEATTLVGGVTGSYTLTARVR